LWFVWLQMDEQSMTLQYLAHIRINTRTLATLAAMGVYQDGVAKNAVNGKQVTAHVFEYTTQISIDPSLQFR
jgi:chitin synthase